MIYIFTGGRGRVGKTSGSLCKLIQSLLEGKKTAFIDTNPTNPDSEEIFEDFQRREGTRMRQVDNFYSEELAGFSGNGFKEDKYFHHVMPINGLYEAESVYNLINKVKSDLAPEEIIVDTHRHFHEMIMGNINTTTMRYQFRNPASVLKECPVFVHFLDWALPRKERTIQRINSTYRFLKKFPGRL